MELYQLKTFVKVADTGNLTRASAALFTSQPAISAQIKALEDELGLQLFSRTPKGMQLTAAGQHLYEHANTTLNAAEQIRQEALSLRNEIVGEVKAGIHTDFDFMLTGKLYQALAEQHPRITLHFLKSSSATVVQQLRDGALDAGFMFGPCAAADIAVTKLCEVPLCIAGPNAVDISKADLQELYQRHWIYTSPCCPFYAAFEQVFAGVKGKPQRLTWADSEEAIRELIKADAGFSLLRRDDAYRLKDNQQASIWPGEVVSLDLNFVTLKRRQHEAAIQAFANCTLENWNLPADYEQSIAG